MQIDTEVKVDNKATPYARRGTNFAKINDSIKIELFKIFISCPLNHLRQLPTQTKASSI